MRGALGGAAVGVGVGAWKDINNSQVKRKNTDSYLYGLSNRVKLDKSSNEYIIVNNKAEFLIKIISRKFGRKFAVAPVRFGSTERGTALRNKFDIDLGFKFKPNSFSSTSDMRLRILKFLDGHVGKNSIIEVREQKNSIGVTFNLNSNAQCKIDVVPVKLSVGSRTNGYLSTDNGSPFGNSYSRKKTNLNVLNNQRLSQTQKGIVVLLKHWKDMNDVPIGSHLLENLVLDAYKYSPYIPKGFTKKVIMVLKHIANKLDVAVIRGKENSNNILTNISEVRKAQIIQACKEAIDEYDYQPNSVTYIFR